jgi:hypothetical protein
MAKRKEPAAEVVITGRRCYLEGLSSGFFCSGQTIESAQDKTLRAQSGGIAGTQFRSALRAI